MDSGQKHPPALPNRRRTLIIATSIAALSADIGVMLSGASEPDGQGASSSSISADFSLIASDSATPDPTAASRTDAPPPAAPPAAPPPAPPPPELKLRYGEGRSDGIPAFVSISNNTGTVGCVYTAVAVAGTGTAVNYTDTVSFTVTGAAETRFDRPGPATGTTWHVTVTCDNGLSTSQEQIY